MQEQFSRTINLIGQTAFDRLKNTKVIIFGLGGVGSFVAESLARAGIENFILVDRDVVSESNINRQSIAFHSTIGMKKTEVTKKMIKNINPKTKIKIKFANVSTKNVQNFGIECADFIIDCIDTVSSKIAIIETAKQNNKRIISSMGTGNKLHPELFRIQDISKTTVCPLAKVIRKELGIKGIKHVPVLYSTETPIKPQTKIEENGKIIPASISTVPSIAGLLIANYVILEIISTKIV